MIDRLLKLVGEDKIEEVLETLVRLLEGSPKLYECLHQSGRLAKINEWNRLRLEDNEKYMVERSRIRWSVLELLKVIEENKSNDIDIERELDEFGKISKSKIVQKHSGRGHNIGGDYIKGDKY